MTGRQKIEAAFSKEGTGEVAVVIPYDGILIRDHWRDLTSCPWWYLRIQDNDLQMLWRREVAANIGQDWFHLETAGYSREDRENISIKVRPEGVFQVDRRTGQEILLRQPPMGGEVIYVGSPDVQANTVDAIDRQIEQSQSFPPRGIIASGRADLALSMVAEFGGDYFLIWLVGTPLSYCCDLWGFEGMMLMIATRPDLVKHACERHLAIVKESVREAALIGAAGVWIEETFTDMISLDAFVSLNVPIMRELVHEIRSVGLKSIYYFTGNPHGKMDAILSSNADAIALEESKKGFAIDIEEVVDVAKRRCVVLGNLDAVGVLQNGSEEQLRTEISRQLTAGKKNGGKFIMSLGSPVTPGTSVARVRLFCDLVHEMSCLTG